MGNLDWLGEALGSVNPWAVLVAAVVVMVWGSIWYMPQLAGESWRKLVGLTKKQMNDRTGMGQMFFGAFVFTLFAAYFLQGLMIATGTEGVWNGALLGMVIGLVFSAMPNATQNLFARKDVQLTAIQGADVLVSMALMGGILGAWM